MFIILTESTRAAEPRKGAFYDPSPGQHLEAMERLGMLDDFQTSAACGTQGAHPLDKGASVAAVSPDAPQPPEAFTQFVQEQASSIAVLHVGWMHADQEDQSQGVDQKMSLSSRHLLASIVSTNSALLSCSHALRIENRSGRGFFLPACTRTASRNASLSRAHTPCFFQWAK